MADSCHLRDSSKSILNIIAKRLNSPAQFWPFPLNPGWHSHTKDPLVFVQVAFTWQEWFPLHSSISEKPYIYNIYMHFITFVTLKWADSQSCNLFDNYIWEKKFNFLFLFHELDIWNVYLSGIFQFIKLTALKQLACSCSSYKTIPSPGE